MLYICIYYNNKINAVIVIQIYRMMNDMNYTRNTHLARCGKFEEILSLFFFFFHLFVKVAALETPELLLRAIFQAIQPFQIKFVHFKSRNRENSFPFSCSNYLLP